MSASRNRRFESAFLQQRVCKLSVPRALRLRWRNQIHCTRVREFYDKLKNDPGWVVHTLPCTHFIQLEMHDELTAILLKAIP